MVKSVTFTGVDNSVAPAELLQLSIKYPFVEWGVLLSRKRQGEPEYPSKDWMQIMDSIATGGEMNVSGHLCGAYVREFLVGNSAFINELGAVMNMFKRLQINMAGEELHYDVHRMAQLIRRLDKGIQVIAPSSWYGEGIMESLAAYNIRPDILFDNSYGAGVLPETWPLPIKGAYCGYAGGLSPDNISENILKINEAAGKVDVWIDLQSGVRSDDRKLFDLEKVEKVLSIVSKYIIGYEMGGAGKQKIEKPQEPETLTRAKLEACTPGGVLAFGIADEPGLYKDGKVKWVAVRGEGTHDWAIYYHKEEKSQEDVMKEGDKVTTEHIIRQLVPCYDEVFALYRK